VLNSAERKRYFDFPVGVQQIAAECEREVTRPIICRTLGLTPDPEPVLKALSNELDQTYRTVAARLPSNPAVRFETVEGKKDLVLSPLDKLEEPPSLLALRDAVAARLPRVDLPEILLEIAPARVSPTRLPTSPKAPHAPRT
jgi:hypothetical protein